MTPASGRTIREIITSITSIAVHCAVLSAVIVASFLHVEPLAGPPPAPEPLLINPLLDVSFPRQGASVPGPPPPRGEAETLASAHQKPTTAEEPPDVVQPQEVSQEIPQPESGIDENGPGTGSTPGFPIGSPFGVDGGAGLGGWGPGNGPTGVLAGLPVPDEPRVLSSEVSPPKRVFYVQPVYPEAARAARAEGTVILEVVVGRTGAVEEARVLKSSPLFDTAAVEAVKRWKYEPALLGGSKPVRVFMTVRVEFRLK